MAEQIALVITQVRKESKLWIHPNLQRPSFSLMFLLKFFSSSIEDIRALKRDFVRENKKPFTAIRTTIKHKHLLQIYVTGRLQES